ncbi:helix-turn-helix domain-containing protein [Agrobacterium tumefaciens]|uniref:helix-turn-helix domain-containing protein n=1 Tax=Agrobacterium tumefaciens TaxID=358 RepID=UPI001573021F|nr:helix-turn-helix domain-containing protein [Agrobacterium tumefaciens]NSZ66987.1 helix-turn-helix transcriptional regulator [Agrobacterium tumefaciens]NTA73342.1 helix-turn-helix transcriptional regulator [Agrobacterium tumefaciens]WIE41150.1 helix-turn-helix domain-containing protein [Agrobacterium tumefaciens]
MTESKKQPDPIDVHVGTRIRLRRTLLGMSQDRLGTSLGITFQQIQKYERGMNRVGASRLQLMANILNVPVSFFFDDAPSHNDNAPAAIGRPKADYTNQFLVSSEGLQLNRAFLKIQDPLVRRRIIELAKTLAAEDEI